MTDQEKYMKIEETISKVSADAEDFGMREAIRRIAEYGLITDRTAQWLLDLQEKGVFHADNDSYAHKMSLQNDRDAIYELCELVDIDPKGCDS